MLYNVSDLPTNDSVVEHKLDIKQSDLNHPAMLLQDF